MKADRKQKLLSSFLHKIDQTVDLQFDMSNRCKRILGTAFYRQRKILLRKPLFKYTLNSMKHCILHELTHLYQYEVTGQSGHNAQFNLIKDMLIADYGTPAIKSSNKATTTAYSDYTYDRSK